MWQGHLLKLRRHFVPGPRPTALLSFFFFPPHPSLHFAKARADSERWFATLWNEQINLQHGEFLDYLPSAALFCNTLKGRGVKHKAWKLEIPECWCLKKAWRWQQQQQRTELWKLAFTYYYYYLWAWAWVCMNAPHVCRALKSHKRALDTLEIKLEVLSIYKSSIPMGVEKQTGEFPGVCKSASLAYAMEKQQILCLKQGGRWKTIPKGAPHPCCGNTCTHMYCIHTHTHTSS